VIPGAQKVVTAVKAGRQQLRVPPCPCSLASWVQCTRHGYLQSGLTPANASERAHWGHKQAARQPGRREPRRTWYICHATKAARWWPASNSATAPPLTHSMTCRRYELRDSAYSIPAVKRGQTGRGRGAAVDESQRLRDRHAGKRHMRLCCNRTVTSRVTRPRLPGRRKDEHNDSRPASWGLWHHCDAPPTQRIRQHERRLPDRPWQAVQPPPRLPLHEPDRHQPPQQAAALHAAGGVREKLRGVFI
jgi:hypothetical protein